MRRNEGKEENEGRMKKRKEERDDKSSYMVK